MRVERDDDSVVVGGAGAGGDGSGSVSIGSGGLRVDGGADIDDSGSVQQPKKRDGGTDSGTGES